MPWYPELSDADLRQYLPVLLTGLGELGAYRRLAGGTYNTAIAVRLQDGPDVVVKISPPHTAAGLTYEAGLLPAEADYFRRTLPHHVPVPNVLAEGVDVVPGRHHLVMSKLPGGPWWELPRPLGEAERAAMRYQLGQVVGRAHQITCQGFGYMFERGALRGPTWPEAFGHMMEAVLDDSLHYKVELPCPADHVRGLLSAGRPALAEVEQPVLVHFDLWDGNVFVARTERGPQVTGIIDSERALHGDPAFDFPSLTYGHRYNDGAGVFSEQLKDEDFVIDEDFSAGYREIVGPLKVSPKLVTRLALYRTYLYLIMLTEVVPRRFSPEQRESRQQGCLPALSQQISWLEANL